jgi:hypothetical protein
LGIAYNLWISTFENFLPTQTIRGNNKNIGCFGSRLALAIPINIKVSTATDMNFISMGFTKIISACNPYFKLKLSKC